MQSVFRVGDNYGAVVDARKTPFHLRMTSSLRLRTTAKARNPGQSDIIDPTLRLPASKTAFGSGLESATGEIGDLFEKRFVGAVVGKLGLRPVEPDLWEHSPNLPRAALEDKAFQRFDLYFAAKMFRPLLYAR